MLRRNLLLEICSESTLLSLLAELARWSLRFRKHIQQRTVAPLWWSASGIRSGCNSHVNRCKHTNAHFITPLLPPLRQFYQLASATHHGAVVWRNRQRKEARKSTLACKSFKQDKKSLHQAACSTPSHFSSNKHSPRLDKTEYVATS